MTGSSETLGAVAAGHQATVDAAAEMLRAGGNAFDAALAGFAAACVAEPVLASLGGGGFLLARPASGDPVLYDFFPDTPGRKKPEDALDFFPIEADFGTVRQEFHIGAGSVAVPGTVAGLFAIHRDLCRLPMEEVFAPAAALARDGVEINDFQAYLLGVVSPIYVHHAESRAIFESRRRPGVTLQPGEILHNPDLGDTLRALADGGPDAFYRGDLANSVLASLTAGGHLTPSDLETYAAARRTPLRQQEGGATILTNPPPSSGGILILFARQLLDGAADPRSLVDAMARTNRARRESGLADDPNADDVLRLLDPDFVARFRGEVEGLYANPRGTTHISVIDKDGNAASMTVSNGEGSGLVVPGTGTMLNNMLGEEDINPAGFHRWPPATRISSMMAPTLLERQSGEIVALGSGGSNRIRTAVLQVLVNLIEGGATLRSAIDAPRLHYENGELNIEPGFDAESAAALARLYPDRRLWDRPNMFFGGVHAVAWHPDGGTFEAAGDARRDGRAAVVS